MTPLADLEFIPFLDKDGKLTTVDTKGVKASVYAVYDEVIEEFARCWVYVVDCRCACTYGRTVLHLRSMYCSFVYGYVTTRKCAHDNSSCVSSRPFFVGRKYLASGAVFEGCG